MKRARLHLLVTASILIVSLHATPIPAYNLLTKGGACPDGFKFPANADLDRTRRHRSVPHRRCRRGL
jgi:hypothetical protein